MRDADRGWIWHQIVIDVFIQTPRPQILGFEAISVSNVANFDECSDDPELSSMVGVLRPAERTANVPLR
jgi:hypothetical protein